MNNKFLRKKPNRLLTARRNYFNLGGLALTLNTLATSAIPGLTLPVGAGIKYPTGWTRPTAGSGISMELLNKAAGVATLAGTSIYNLANKAVSSDIDKSLSNFLNQLYTTYATPVNNDSYDQLSQDWVNNAHLRKTTKKDFGAVGGGQMAGNFIKNAAAGASAGSAFGGIGAGVGAALSGIFGWVGDLARNSKARSASNKANALIAERNDQVDRSLYNRGLNLNSTTALNAYANSAAYGGLFNSIHGGYFSNGLSYVNNGGTHEANPYGGVIVGIDPEGTPNQVEEGETIFNDFVFSNRIKVPKGLRKKYKLGGPITFADASQKLAKESEERPNDPISKNGLMALMGDLANMQEQLKAKDEMKALQSLMAAQQHALGGNLFKKGGPYDYLSQEDQQKIIEEKEAIFNNLPVGLKRFFENFKEFETFLNKEDISTTRSALYRELKPFYDKLGEGYVATKPFSKEMSELLKPDKKTGKFSDELMKLDNAVRRYGYQLNGFKTPWTNAAYTPADLLKIKENLKGMLGGEFNWADGEGDIENLDDLIKYYGLENPDYSYTFEDELPVDFLQDLFNVQDGNSAISWFRNDLLKGTSERLISSLFPEEPESSTNTDELDAKLMEELAADDSLTLLQDITKTAQYTPKLPEDTSKYFYYREGPEGTPVKAHDWDDFFVRQGHDINDYVVIGQDSSGNNIYARKKTPPPLQDPVNKLEMASIFGPALGVAWQALNDNTDDDLYQSSLDAAKNSGKVMPISYNGIGDYITPKPFALDYAAVQARNAANATNRQLANTSGGNRGTAMAGILANEYNAQKNMGDLYRQASIDSHDRLLKDLEFNRSTNINNTEGEFKAAQANQSAYLNSGDAYVRAVTNANSIKQAARLERDRNMSANLTGLFQNIGNYGRQQTNYNMMRHLIEDKGIAPGYTFTMDNDGGLSVRFEERKNAKGGKLKRKKRGLTY